MRKSKHVGFAVICLAIVLMAAAAVLPVSPATQRFGPFRIDIRGDNCGPAAYVALRDTNSVCREAAQRRLLTTTGVGLLVVALGMAMFAGGDAPRGSRVDVASPWASRRTRSRSPGSRRYKPG
ncbi:MAG: hypothetical protein M3450_16410 [Actinomycetota bacterium]|nr:hypothetical protein [Actinomycetota bacterium]